MEKDSRSRKWQLTVNNPLEKGLGHDMIKALVNPLSSLLYWCMADEVGENQTYHTHIYLHFKDAVRFSTLKGRFPQAHMEMSKGTAAQNMAYISKTGKWERDAKSETRVAGTFEEFGDMPIERQGRRNDLDDLYSYIKLGMSDYEILEQDPSYMLHLDKIERARQLVLQENYKDSWRELEVTYIYGDTGSGKTRSVMEKYGFSNVYRVTDYAHPFDGYKAQDVVVFEEFRSSLGISDMLKYCDGYPLELPCRYANKYACYTKVFIISNIPVSQQYVKMQFEEECTFQAFLRRIGKVLHYSCGKVESYNVELLASGFRLAYDSDVPF